MIGARFSLYPLTDAFVPRILEALAGLDDAVLERETDDISTFVSGEENTLFRALERVFGRATEPGEHVVMSLLLSRGCPGEPGEDLCNPAAAPSQTAEREAAAENAPSVACQFSLYPLGVGGYMKTIYAEIGAARTASPLKTKGPKTTGLKTTGPKTTALKVTPQHLCTRLEGPLPEVFAQLRRAFGAAAEHTPHVVIHATLSAHSPSHSSSHSPSRAHEAAGEGA